jgi:glycosyltransferase involved in cell wall biosynthesis
MTNRSNEQQAQRMIRNVRVLMSGPLPPAIGGMASVIDMLARSSLSDRCELTLFETGKTTPANRSPMQGLRARWRVMTDWWSHLGRADLAHIHTCSGLTFALDGLLLLLARARRVPVVLHIHGARFDDFLDRLGPVTRALARMVARRAHRVIVLSDEWLERLTPRLPGSNLKVVANGVAAPRTVEGSQAPNDRVEFLFLGSLGTRKGVPDLLSALARSSGQWQLLLAGGEEHPGDLERVQKDIDRLGITDRVHVLGPVVGDAKACLLGRVSGFVLPSHAEGLPIALLEAMAAGLPVVVSTVGAMPEVVRDGQEGWVIEPGDVDALANALDRLASSATERERMGRIARDTCERRYGIERMVESLIHLYDQCLAGIQTTTSLHKERP